MSHSSTSAGLVLPFGSLMGSIPMDSIQPGRVLGDFGKALGEPGNRSPELPIAAMSFGGRCMIAGAALPPSLSPSRDGGI
jgi:hypothetical protein